MYNVLIDGHYVDNADSINAACLVAIRLGYDLEDFDAGRIKIDPIREVESKGDIVKRVYDDASLISCTLPMQHQRALLDAGADPSFYVYNVNTNRVEHLLEVEYKKERV